MKRQVGSNEQSSVQMKVISVVRECPELTDEEVTAKIEINPYQLPQFIEERRPKAGRLRRVGLAEAPRVTADRSRVPRGLVSVPETWLFHIDDKPVVSRIETISGESENV